MQTDLQPRYRETVFAALCCFLRDCGCPVDKGLTIETGGGVMTAKLLYPETIETTMPSPNFSARQLPELREVLVGNETFSILPVTVGNPHGVIFGPKRDIAFAQTYGPLLEKHRMFPEGANIELCAGRIQDFLQSGGLGTRCRNYSCLRLRFSLLPRAQEWPWAFQLRTTNSNPPARWNSRNNRWTGIQFSSSTRFGEIVF